MRTSKIVPVADVPCVECGGALELMPATAVRVEQIETSEGVKITKRRERPILAVSCASCEFIAEVPFDVALAASAAGRA